MRLVTLPNDSFSIDKLTNIIGNFVTDVKLLHVVTEVSFDIEIFQIFNIIVRIVVAELPALT